MTKTDKLIFWGVLFVCAAFLLFSNIIFAKQAGKTVVVEIDGAQYASYNLAELTEEKTLEIQTEYGYQEIVLTKTSVTVTKSDCEDKSCLGTIEKQGELLICLPHKLLVKLEGDGEVDGVAY